VVCVACFWDSTGASFRLSKKQHPEDDVEKGGLRKILFKMPAARVSWICSIFLLGYVGIEVALGGWVVTFMKEVRHAAPFSSSMTSTGFWLGITIGRIILGFVTPLIGEKIAITVSDPILLVVITSSMGSISFVNRFISRLRSHFASFYTWFRTSSLMQSQYPCKDSS
jgi:fucose permease